MAINMQSIAEAVKNKLETGKAVEDLTKTFFSDYNECSEPDLYRLGNHAAYQLVMSSSNRSNLCENGFIVSSQRNTWECQSLTTKLSSTASNNFQYFDMEPNNFPNTLQPPNNMQFFPVLKASQSNKLKAVKKKYPIRCRHCGFVLPTLYDRKRHEELAHGSFLLVCDCCNRKFHTKVLLTKHIYNSKCMPASHVVRESDKISSYPSHN